MLQLVLQLKTDATSYPAALPKILYQEGEGQPKVQRRYDCVQKNQELQLAKFAENWHSGNVLIVCSPILII